MTDMYGTIRTAKSLRTSDIPHSIIGLVLYFVSSIAVGIFFSKLIEYPVLRVRDRWFPTQELAQAIV